MRNEQCQSYLPLDNWCRDGFPQRAACIGIDAGLPFCMNDELCARLFPDGKPDLLRIEQIRKVPQ